MVNFRLTRSQRAAVTSSTAAARSSSSQPTSPHNRSDEAPYHRIESRVNSFAGPSSSSAGERGAVPRAGAGGGRGPDPAAPSAVAAAAAAAASSSTGIAPGRDPDLQNSRGRPGSANSSGGSRGSPSRKSTTRRVLRLLDSPRRKILGKRNMNGPFGSSSGTSERPASGGGNGGRTSTGQGENSTSGAAAAAAASGATASSSSSSRGVSLLSGMSTVTSRQQVSPHYNHFQLRGSSSGTDKKIAAVDLPTGRSGAINTATYPVQETAPPTNNTFSTPVQQATTAMGAAHPSSVESKYSDPANILAWLHNDAPADILPRVLSYAGSRKIAALSRTSKSWRTLCLSETVWQTACEDTGKFRPGVDPPLQTDTTWLQHYRDNPLVPTDYDTIQAAFYKRHRSVSTGKPDWRRSDPGNRHPSVPEHDRNLRVLLKPKTYVLKEALVVHALGRAEVTIETVDGPAERRMVGCEDMEDESTNEGRGASSSERAAAAASSASASSTASVSAKRRLRDLLSCRSTSVVGGGEGGAGGDNNQGASDEEDASSDLEDLVSPPSSAAAYARFRSESMPNLPQDPDGCYPKYAKRRAVLILKTKKNNEPVVRVRQGTLRLKDVDCIHNASGTDIWNGNSAVQVQPPLDEAGEFAAETAAPNVPATAVVDSCGITSLSGRGVVTIDGGFATVKDSHVHHCAATGIYIGGPGSVATIHGTDVVRNGYGNKRNRRGIARGHSGVYLEQGTATLRDCNISNNALTGISAVSADNATLDIRDSDLMANESIQLEMPPRGSASERRSISRDNRIVAEGVARSRSGLVPPPEDVAAVASPSTRYAEAPRSNTNNNNDDDRPQSPLSDAESPGWVANF